MTDQLITILKKRYGLFLAVAIIAILGIYTLSGVNGVNSWKINYNYFKSEEHLEVLKTEGSNFFTEDKYHGLSLDEKMKLYQAENLNIIRYYDYSNDEVPFTDKGNIMFYSSSYYVEAFLPLLILVGTAGFLLFFADLKSSFNTFLFSLGISKRKIFWYKHLLISVPFLLSLLIGKCILTGIILMNIPEQYLNISNGEIVSSIIGSWITLILYFFAGSFIGLVTGNLILGPLTALGFTVSLSWFVASCTNGWTYFTGNYSDNGTYSQKEFFYQLAQNKVSWLNVAITILGILLILFVSSYLYPKLSLEKNGNYLLFDALRIPILVLFIFYVSITFTFVGGLYNYITTSEKPTSPIPLFIISSIFSGLIGSYVIYRNQINVFFYQKFILKKRTF